MGSNKRRASVSKPTLPVGPRVEYRHVEDDAWYDVLLVLFGETLTIKFTEFRDDNDVVFHAQDFTTFDAISHFHRLFRPLSLQLEASDCATVKEGMRVCAILDLGHQGRRFFDAIVEAVKREEHTIVNGTEECSCSVVLSWLHGPKDGTQTLGRVEDLCPIQSENHLDPRLACFLQLARWKHGIASPSSNLIFEGVACTEEKPSFQCKQCKSWNLIQKSEGRKQMEGKFCYERNEDVDLGGGGHVHTIDDPPLSLDKLVKNVSYIGLGKGDNPETGVMDEEERYFIVVENLEKDVSSSTIVSFVQEATGLKIDAFVFLNLSSEPYTWGALVVDCVEDLEKLCDFVVEPEQMIISSKGRPWIVTDPSATQSVRPSFWCLEPDLKKERQLSAGGGLKVVKLGSDEYSKAEKLRAIFREFTDHLQKLSKRLVIEEQHILDA